MYASLGDIVFEALTTFDALSDQRETNYSVMPLINGKPNLQKTGESLIEFSMGINFHVAFCNPEDEYLKLNRARIEGTPLPFIYGNGFNEGTFVITKLERTINQTDKIGNFVHISCNVTLLEYTGADSSAKQLEQDKKNAFAISANRPLPSKASATPLNPALNVCEENKLAQQSAAAIDDATNKVNDSVGLINSGLIDKAQKFVDQVEKYISDVQKEIDKANNALGSINALLGAYTSLTGISTTLPTKITAVQTALTASSVQLTALGTLPSTISNLTEANTALTALTNTVTTMKTLKDNTKLMNDAASEIARAVAFKKVIT